MDPPDSVESCHMLDFVAQVHSWGTPIRVARMGRYVEIRYWLDPIQPSTHPELLLEMSPIELPPDKVHFRRARFGYNDPPSQERDEITGPRHDPPALSHDSTGELFPSHPSDTGHPLATLPRARDGVVEIISQGGETVDRSDSPVEASLSPTTRQPSRLAAGEDSGPGSPLSNSTLIDPDQMGLGSSDLDLSSIHLANASESSHASQSEPEDQSTIPKKKTSNGRREIKSRRWRVPYTRQEIEALFEGIDMFGPDFKQIQKYYADVFHAKRTPVNLFDKWRHSLKQTTLDKYIKEFF